VSSANGAFNGIEIERCLALTMCSQNRLHSSIKYINLEASFNSPTNTQFVPEFVAEPVKYHDTVRRGTRCPLVGWNISHIADVWKPEPPRTQEVTGFLRLEAWIPGDKSYQTRRTHMPLAVHTFRAQLFSQKCLR
jgi:hypothetical protein